MMSASRWLALGVNKQTDADDCEDNDMVARYVGESPKSGGSGETCVRRSRADWRAGILHRRWNDTADVEEVGGGDGN